MTSRASKSVKCQNCQREFTVEPEDFDFYEKIQVPAPTFCPECRLKRHMCFLNERSLYKRKCDMCGENVVSMYSPDKKIIVYCCRCWWSDKWDGGQYARGYNPSIPFLKQIKELMRQTPQMALESNYLALKRSEYVNYASTCKNCYLSYVADRCENVFYSEILLDNKDSLDGTMYRNCELCYSLLNCRKCYKVFFSEDCENCQEVYFSKDCNGCSNCFGCIGLRSKQYYIFNRPHAKNEYQREIDWVKIGSYLGKEELKEKAIKFWQRFPRKFSHSLHNLEVTGDYVYESKKSKDMYIVHSGAEECRYCQMITMPRIRDSYDYTGWGNNASRIYDAAMVGEGADSVKFSYEIWPNVREIEYSTFVLSSSNMFGCSNIRNRSYCILNKQYTKEEYEKLVPKIIDQMNKMPYVDKKGRVYKYGEFFPPELSPFCYNETIAQEYFPLTKEQAIEQGYKWKDPEPRNYQITIKAKDLPDHIKDVKDDILDQIIGCEHQGKCNEQCTEAFKIIPQELQFYRRMNLPLPRLCPNCRHYQRLKQRNPLKLWPRQCMCHGVKSSNGVYINTIKHFHGDQPCPNEFETTYSPDRPEIVYCEKCYQSEVV